MFQNTKLTCIINAYYNCILLRDNYIKGNQND